MTKRYIIAELKSKDVTDHNSLFIKEEFAITPRVKSHYFGRDAYDTLDEAEQALSCLLNDSYSAYYTILPLYT